VIVARTESLADSITTAYREKSPKVEIVHESNTLPDEMSASVGAERTTGAGPTGGSVVSLLLLQDANRKNVTINGITLCMEYLLLRQW
jgi:hypothetical protein